MSDRCEVIPRVIYTPERRVVFLHGMSGLCGVSAQAHTLPHTWHASEEDALDRHVDELREELEFERLGRYNSERTEEASGVHPFDPDGGDYTW